MKGYLKTSDKRLLERTEHLTETRDPDILKYQTNLTRYVCKKCGFARRKYIEIQRHQELGCKRKKVSVNT